MKETRHNFTPQEQRISALPSGFAALVVLLILVFNGTQLLGASNPSKAIILAASGLFGSIYIVVFNIVIISSPKFKPLYSWLNSIIGGFGIGLITVVLPDELDILTSILMILTVITTAIISERYPAYLLTLLATTLTLFFRFGYFRADLREWSQHFSLAAIAIIMTETIHQLKSISREHIRRLETINEFSRKIAYSLETQQVISLLNAAIQNALEADTYFLGILEDEFIHLNLFYDDGEYFYDQKVALEGSLSGWVIKNQRELFLPDLRQDVDLEGVRKVIVGKDKTSLSWMGVPLQGTNIQGVIAIASYRPNVFNRADLELLANLARHATLALDNTIRHAQVEQQAQLDSLTGVYNHGHFLKLLKEQADQSLLDHQPLSLIMLDIDHFKEYNDTYGHLTGDEILTSLCTIIKRHVKRTDAVGRWGGEEFIISLLNAAGGQAQQVAERIRETMAGLIIHNHEDQAIPAPSVSQGIAIYPEEANEIIRLIDLADRRLYIAKERGRNQIEPDASHWKRFKTADGKK